MGRTVRGPWPLLGLALLLAACSGTAGVPTVNTEYAHPTVTASHTVQADDIGARAPLLLASPDGSKVYSVSHGAACITTLADSTSVCATDSGPAPPSASWARWAPDGHAVALTEDFRRTLHEPDIWLMDAADGTVTNLTDDGAGKVLGDEHPVLDMMPVWQDDSTLLFVRQRGTDAADLAIASVSESGGEVRVLTRLDTTVSYLNAIALDPDGHAIAYSVSKPDRKGSTVYLHPLDPASGAGSTDSAAPEPAPSTAPDQPTGSTGDTTATGDTVVLNGTYDASLLAFSPDGQYLLVDNLLPTGMVDSVDDPESRVIRIDGPEAMPIAADMPAWYPTWSPTGHALAFLSGVEGGTLHAVSQPGAGSHQLSDTTIRGVTSQRLAWTASGLLVRTGTGVTVLTVSTR